MWNLFLIAKFGRWELNSSVVTQGNEHHPLALMVLVCDGKFESLRANMKIVLASELFFILLRIFELTTPIALQNVYSLGIIYTWGNKKSPGKIMAKIAVEIIEPMLFSSSRCWNFCFVVHPYNSIHTLFINFQGVVWAAVSDLACLSWNNC